MKIDYDADIPEDIIANRQLVEKALDCIRKNKSIVDRDRAVDIVEGFIMYKIPAKDFAKKYEISTCQVYNILQKCLRIMRNNLCYDFYYNSNINIEFGNFPKYNRQS